MTKEEKNAYAKAYRLANKELIKSKQKQYYLDNRERLLAYANANSKTYYEANKEASKTRKNAYYEANPEYFKNYRDTVYRPYRSMIDVPEGYDVHHLNHDHDDNRRTNLLAMTRADHAAYHQFMKYGNYEKASEIIYNYEVF